MAILLDLGDDRKVALAATYAPTNNTTKGTPEEKLQRTREREDFYHKFLHPRIELIKLDTNEIIIHKFLHPRIDLNGMHLKQFATDNEFIINTFFPGNARYLETCCF